jgi:hypothetical protein
MYCLLSQILNEKKQDLEDTRQTLERMKRETEELNDALHQAKDKEVQLQEERKRLEDSERERMRLYVTTGRLTPRASVQLEAERERSSYLESYTKGLQIQIQKLETRKEILQGKKG